MTEENKRRKITRHCTLSPCVFSKNFTRLFIQRPFIALDRSFFTSVNGFGSDLDLARTRGEGTGSVGGKRRRPGSSPSTKRSGTRVHPLREPRTSHPLVSNRTPTGDRGPLRRRSHKRGFDRFDDVLQKKGLVHAHRTKDPHPHRKTPTRGSQRLRKSRVYKRRFTVG